MELENLYEFNRIIELAIEYGRGDAYVEVLLDAMDDFLNAIEASDDYTVDDGDNIPQFIKNT